MADALDPRRVIVSIEIDGEFRVYEELDIRARGQKTANPLQNTCEVSISNLTAETRNYLLTETSPFNKNKRPKRVIVEAGRVGAGITRLFYGEVTSSEPTQPPDIGLNLKAQTGTYAKGKVIARSGAAQSSLRSLAQKVAQDIGASLDFQATDKQIANYAFNGSALRQIDALANAGAVDAYLDDEILVVKNRAVPLSGRIRELSQDSGMIGQPEVTEKGVKVRMLLDSNTVIGGAIQLTSKLNPALNGLYSIYALDFEVANRAQEFYYVANCERT